MHRGIKRIKAVDSSQVRSTDIIHLIIILPLKADAVTIQPQMAVGINKSGQQSFALQIEILRMIIRILFYLLQITDSCCTPATVWGPSG